jgi:hypothetical protein
MLLLSVTQRGSNRYRRRVPTQRLRVRVEIIGSPKCRIVGESQSVLMMINPIIFTRTRSPRRVHTLLGRGAGAAWLHGGLGRSGARTPHRRLPTTLPLPSPLSRACPPAPPPSRLCSASAGDPGSGRTKRHTGRPEAPTPPRLAVSDEAVGVWYAAHRHYAVARADRHPAPRRRVQGAPPRISQQQHLRRALNGQKGVEQQQQRGVGQRRGAREVLCQRREKTRPAFSPSVHWHTSSGRRDIHEYSAARRSMAGWMDR